MLAEQAEEFSPGAVLVGAQIGVVRFARGKGGDVHVDFEHATRAVERDPVTVLHARNRAVGQCPRGSDG
jgi:hypothetical protein